MGMIKLNSNSHISREHFDSPFSYFVIESVREGNTLAEAYVDCIDHPQISIVWDKKHNISCGGRASKAVMGKAAEFIKSELLTQEVRNNSEIVKISYENHEWKDVLLEVMQELQPKIYPRSIYRHGMIDIPDLFPVEQNVTVQSIDMELLKAENMGYQKYMVDEIELMWGSVEAFIRKGFGYCAVKDNEVLSWCTGEYFSSEYCGIGIETVEPYQGKGIASAAASGFLRHCRENGKIPHWDCWKNNIPSVKTAEKVGFEKLADYEIIFLCFV